MKIECGKGHMYDPDLYSVCPYCNSAHRVVNFAQTPVEAGGKTMPIMGTQGGGAIPPTVPIAGADPFGGRPVSGEGKTLPPQGYAPRAERAVDEDNKTVGVMKKKLGIDPVVGWLVCISGSQKGKDFRLLGRINSIGKDRKMDVHIEGDETISSENHARLSYSEKNNGFKLIPGNSTNLIYLNGEEIFEATSLKAYDIIELGAETKVIFVPLCSEQFEWKNTEE